MQEEVEQRLNRMVGKKVTVVFTAHGAVSRITGILVRDKEHNEFFVKSESASITFKSDVATDAWASYPPIVKIEY